MNKIKILLLGFAAISAPSLCLAVAAAPPPVTAVEKVISFDNAGSLPASVIASCDFASIKLVADIEREAAVVSNTYRQPAELVGRTTHLHAKVSAHGRTCRLSALSQPLTEYEQRM